MENHFDTGLDELKQRLLTMASHAETAVNREYETRLYDYYGRPADWTTGGFAESARPELR